MFSNMENNPFLYLKLPLLYSWVHVELAKQRFIQLDIYTRKNYVKTKIAGIYRVEGNYYVTKEKIAESTEMSLCIYIHVYIRIELLEYFRNKNP